MKNEIETYDELLELVETDSNSHKLNEIAMLFLNAMNDWPSYNQNLIAQFIIELKEYYGSPISLEKIDLKKIDLNVENNSLRSSAGSLVADMIEVSRTYYNETNFDKIIENIFRYYSTS